MKKRFLGGLLAAVILFSTGCAGIQEYFENPLEDGLQYLKEEKYAQAVASFEKAIEKEYNRGRHTEESVLPTGSRKITIRRRKH